MWTPRLLPAALPTSSRPKRTSSSCWLTPEAGRRILAEGKAAAEAERQHKLRQADAQTTALARAMCEKLLARSLNEQDDARLLDDLLEKAGAENGK